jgi:tetratricopeptide (TPR) repeat protein
LAIFEKIDHGSLDSAWALAALGDLAAKQGNLTKAEGFHRRALEIRKKMAPNSRRHAESLHALAFVLGKNGQSESAAALFSRSLAALEGQTTQLGATERVCSAFRGGFSRYYQDYADLLVDQRSPRKHSLSPSVRARVLFSPCWQSAILSSHLTYPQSYRERAE